MKTSKRFMPDDLTGLIDYGIGAFVWDKGVHPRLLVIIPCESTKMKWEVVKLNVKGWGSLEGLHGWDNNFDKPTLEGSIPGASWHGWLIDGFLTTKKPEA